MNQVQGPSRKSEAARDKASSRYIYNICPARTESQCLLVHSGHCQLRMLSFVFFFFLLIESVQ